MEAEIPMNPPCTTAACAAAGGAGGHPCAPTRRAFLARVALVAAAPMLGRCGRDDGGGSSASQEPLGGEAGSLRARPVLPTREPRMRVRVVAARGTEAQARIGDARQWLRLGPASREGPEVVLRGPLEIGVGAERWSIIDANGVRGHAEGLEPLALAALSTNEPVVPVADRSYPGSMRLHARPDLGDGAFDVINVVDMEEYLPGVVAGELFDHWRLETRSAQAVAARSFAASEHAQAGGRRAYDVTSTPASQVYRGLVDHEETLEAVRMTRGLVLSYEGLLVPGYYSSCCGGLAARAVDAIGRSPVNDTPPLYGRRGVDVCTDAKIARWTIERPVETLTRRLVAWGDRRGRPKLEDLAEVAAIEVIERNEHGRPTRYAVADRKERRVEMDADHLRSAANYAGPGLSPPRRPLWSSHVSVTVRDRTVVFEGRGYGHGVGMCQYGAETLARSGMDYRSILRWYYPGADLTRAYT
jgi:stage II sporulation protein D